MPILASLLTMFAVLGARVAVERSKYFQEHAKTLPQLPLGL